MLFFPRVILLTLFSFLLIYGGLGVGVLELGSWRIGFFGLWFQLMGFGVCGVGLSGLFWDETLYINTED